MSDGALLTVCVSSYNKGGKCFYLIKKILKLNDRRINIVVSDDCSDPDTASILSSIDDDRVVVFHNSSNLGACANWFETLNRGNGKYLLHVLDRDYIDTLILEEFVDFIECNDVGIGYIGYELTPYRLRSSTIKAMKFPAGEGTAAELGGIPIHPTGFFINKDEWDADKFRVYFFNENDYGIYPHSYLIGIVALHKDVLLFRKTFCRYVYSQSCKSQFYSNKKNTMYWWEPKQIFYMGEKMLITLMTFFSSDDSINDFILNIFRFCITRSTIGYRNELLDKRQMAHYSLHIKEVSLARLLFLDLLFTIRFLHFLNKNGLKYARIIIDILSVSVDNIRKIINLFWKKKEIIRRVNDDNKKKNEFYKVLCMWLKTHVDGNHIIDYFVEHRYQRVAIYGMKEIGELLYDEIVASDSVRVIYAIDRNKNIEYKDIRILDPNDVLPEVDVIVVTAIHYYNEIEDKLRDVVKCPVISIEDIIYGM